MVVVIAEENGGVVISSGVEYVHSLDGVSAALLLPFGSFEGRLQTILCQDIIGQGVQDDTKLLGSQLIVAILQELTGVCQSVFDGSLVVSDGIAIGGYCLRRGIDFLIAMRHLQGTFTSLVTLLGGCLRVSLLELLGSIVVFAQSQELLTFLQVLVDATACQ